MSILILSVFGLATVFWLWMLVESIRKEEAEAKIAWAIVILFTYVLGALVYFIFVRPRRLRTVVSVLLVLSVSLSLTVTFLSISIVRADTIKEHTYEWPWHTGIANVWFRVDNANCTIERIRCELTGWTSIGLYWAWVECYDDAIEQKKCTRPDSQPGIQKCLTTTVTLMNAVGADIPFVGEVKIASWEEGRTTITECTDCCPTG